MAKRSDFAQKLLDDLRLRKERMAAGQTSGRSSTMTGETYSYYRQTQKGFTEIKKHDIFGSKAGHTPKRSKGENRPLTIGDSSKQIVSYGRGRGSEQMGDLSLALALALENGGKLGKMNSSGSNSVLGFLHQIGRRSGNFGKMEKGRSVDMHRSSTSQFPTLSPLQVKEISKGAQKLNQILRACSNGINFDSYSIEIGKELLKGAMDLQESLRMLVNLQEASEHMVTPQRKNRIKLLEGDEDEDDDIVKVDEQKQLDRPIFSFDKPSRGTHQVSRTGLKQRLTLTYSSEASNLNHESRALVTSNSQSGSARYVNDFKALGVLSEHKKTSSSARSKPDKGIPNIIAKLMGLEEIPGAMDSKHGTQTDLSSRQKMDGRDSKKTALEGTKNDEPKSKHAENMALQTARQRVKQSTKTLVTQNTAFGQQAEKNPGTRNANLEMVVHNGKPPWKDSENVEGKNAGTATKKATAKISKQQQSNIQLTEITGSQNGILENARRRDDSILREHKVMERRETKEPFLKHVQLQVAPPTHIIPEAAKGLQHKTGQNGSTPQAEQRYANRLFPSHQQNMVNNLGLHELNMIQKSEHQQEKHQAAEKEQNVRQKSQGGVQKGIEVVSKSSSKSTHETVNLQKKHPHLNQSTHGKKSSTDAIDAMPHKGFPNTKHHENMVRYGSPTNLKVNIKDSMHKNFDQSASRTDVELQSKKAKANILPIMKEKAVHVTPAQKKIDNTKVHKRETPRKIDEVMTRRNGTNLVRPLKHPISILQEMKQRRQDKIGGTKRAEQGSAVRHKEAEVHIINSKKSEANTQPFAVAQKLHKDAELASSLYGSVGLNAKFEFRWHPNKVPLISKARHLFLSKIKNRVSQNCIKSAYWKSRKKCGSLSYCSTGAPEISKSRTQQQPLTENENHLKQILIKSQLFLNTAEALFKLNVPVGILHASGHDCHDEESRLILDCGYELMRRKGKRQELSVHPFVKISISSTKIASLDDLVKQLHIDFEKLKSCGRDGSDDCDAADYLPKMLELDVQTMDPDVNCLWDLGWNDKMFAFIEKDDVIRDVERHVFSGLIGEITRDFLHLSIPN
ncbi:uncharacterized protein LOC117905397 [Vitis riparia]|uniref:uncharacterized protein LOC117905397 n=1 Tax=Vitis riparia TaxID=96939 RepID=UPI00155A10CA|nr:uncharacterized protein LOC117905397 [Vitis riparia]